MMHGKSLALIAALTTWVAAPAFAQILPSGPAVVSGNASFATVGNVLTVTNSNGTIINWQSFNIGAGNTTNFAQPSASSAVLNRVLDASASVINGMLSSNGRVFLVNPNGLLFGSTSQVNVGGLVASTLNITDANFQSGNLQFAGAGAPGAITINGSVTVPGDGYVVLLAPTITIAGNVSAGGFLGLGTGNASSLVGSAASITGLISVPNSGSVSIIGNGSLSGSGSLSVNGPIGLGTGPQTLLPTGGLALTTSGSNTGDGSNVLFTGSGSNTGNGSISIGSGAPVLKSTGQATLPASVDLTRSKVAGGTIALADGNVTSNSLSNTLSPVVSATGPTSIALVLEKRESAF